MRKSNKNQTDKPDPYEDIIRSEKLDPYETLINLFDISKQKKSKID